MLVKVLRLFFNSHAVNLKKSFAFRERPYLMLEEPFKYSQEERQLYGESSYPSRHALIGWGLAMALAEVMPDCQQALLTRGYDYGESRVIKGMCFASDIMAARVIAMCDLGKLHNENLFATLFEKAKQEYRLKRNLGDVNGDGHVNSVDVTALYNYLLNGDETYLATSDVDGDGQVTTVDITVIYNILLASKKK